MARVRWTQARLNEYLVRNPDITVQIAHLERHVKPPIEKKAAYQALGERVRIRVHSKRKRLTDPDGLYFKAAMDGLTAGGLLIDDSSRFVASIEHSQEQVAEKEETIITIEAFEELAR